jgi:hypothetical protein
LVVRLKTQPTAQVPSPDPELSDSNGLANAFQLAVCDVLSNNLSGKRDEEGTTGALLGAIAANVAWQNATSESQPCSWVHYRKSGRGLLDEPFTGADFALIIRVAEDRFHFAIFQAKRATNREGSFKVDHISPARPPYPPELQFKRLVRHGLQISCPPASKDLSVLNWVHYLVYEKGEITYRPLSDYQSHYDRLLEFEAKLPEPTKPRTLEDTRNAWAGFYPKHLDERRRSPGTFLDLLERGTHDSLEGAKGWLPMETTEAEIK